MQLIAWDCLEHELINVTQAQHYTGKYIGINLALPFMDIKVLIVLLE